MCRHPSIVLVEHLQIGVAKESSSFCHVFVFCHMIGGERMPEAIVRVGHTSSDEGMALSFLVLAFFTAAALWLLEPPRVPKLGRR